jgi:hypothetical protein
METTYQRKYERVPFSTRVEVRDQGSGMACTGRSIDLSRGGIGFFADRFLPKGSRIRLTVNMRVSGRPVAVTLDATIMRSQTEGDGGIMGAQFDKVLSPQDQSVLCGVVDSRA